LNPTEEQPLKSYESIYDLTPSDYGRPLSKCFESIDALSPPNILYQMTVSGQHPIKANGFHKVEAILFKMNHGEPWSQDDETEDPFDLYFVVPPDRFDSFKEQNFVTGNNVAVDQPPQNVTQYALKIPLSPA